MRSHGVVGASMALLAAHCGRAVTPGRPAALDASAEASGRDVATAERARDAGVDAPLPLTPTTLQPYASCIPSEPGDAAAPPTSDAATPPRDAGPPLLAADVVVTPEACATAISGTISGGVTLTRGADGGLPCGDGAPESCVRHVYAFALNERAVVDVRSETDDHPDFSIRAHCDDPAAVRPSVLGGIADTAQLEDEWVLEPGTWFVESTATNGASASVSFARPASNYGCGSAEPAAFCTPIHPPPGAGALYEWQGCDPPHDATFERVVSYRVEMPAESVLHVVGASALGCGPYAPFGPEAFFAPYDAGPQVIGVRRSSDPFYLEALPAAANRVYNAAARLGPGTSATQNTCTAGSAGGPRCLRDASLYYVLDAPPHTASRVVANGSGVMLDVAASCEALGAPSDAPYALITNDGETPARRIVRISSRIPSGGASFTLSVDQLGCAEAAPNSFCASPAELRAGDAPLHQDPARAYATCVECGAAATGAALYYRVRLPAHHTGRVTVSASDWYAYGPLRCGERPDGGAPMLYPAPTDGGAPGIPLANDTDSAREFDLALTFWNYPGDAPTPFDIQWIDGG